MVPIKDSAKIEFSARLNEALDGISDCPSEHGRAVWLARAVPFKVTPKGVGKWLKGEAIPTRENMKLLAKTLRVSKSWLSEGEGSKLGADDYSPAEQEVLRLFEEASPERQKIVIEILRAAVEREK